MTLDELKRAALRVAALDGPPTVGPSLVLYVDARAQRRQERLDTGTDEPTLGGDELRAFALQECKPPAQAVREACDEQISDLNSCRPALPLVVTAWLPLNRSQTKHGYDLRHVRLACRRTMLSSVRAPTSARSCATRAARWSPFAPTSSPTGASDGSPRLWRALRALTSRHSSPPRSTAPSDPATVRRARSCSYGSPSPSSCCSRWSRTRSSSGSRGWTLASTATARTQEMGHVPPAPWLTAFPERGLAVRAHTAACHNNKLAHRNHPACFVGTYLFGTRHAWSRFAVPYLARVRDLITTQDEWRAKRLHMLCQDQDIFTEVALGDLSLVEFITPPSLWGWHDVTGLVAVGDECAPRNSSRPADAARHGEQGRDAFAQRHDVTSSPHSLQSFLDTCSQGHFDNSSNWLPQHPHCRHVVPQEHTGRHIAPNDPGAASCFPRSPLLRQRRSGCMWRATRRCASSTPACSLVNGCRAPRSTLCIRHCSAAQ